MRYIRQIVVLNQHLHDLQAKMTILIRMKNDATRADKLKFDKELNDLQDEILNTNSAMSILNGLV